MQIIRIAYTLTVLDCADVRHVWPIIRNVRLKIFVLSDVNGLDEKEMHMKTLEQVAADYGLTPDGVSFALEQYQKVICGWYSERSQ